MVKCLISSSGRYKGAGEMFFILHSHTRNHCCGWRVLAEQSFDSNHCSHGKAGEVRARCQTIALHWSSIGLEQHDAEQQQCSGIVMAYPIDQIRCVFHSGGFGCLILHQFIEFLGSELPFENWICDDRFVYDRSNIGAIVRCAGLLDLLLQTKFLRAAKTLGFYAALSKGGVG